MPSASTNSMPQCSLSSVPHPQHAVERGIAVFPEHAGSTSGKPVTGLGRLHPWGAPCDVIESLRVKFCGCRKCCLCVVVHSGQILPASRNRHAVSINECWKCRANSIELRAAPRSAKLFSYRAVVPLPVDDCFVSADATHESIVLRRAPARGHPLCWCLSTVRVR